MFRLPNNWHRKALQMVSWCAKMRQTGNCRNVWIIVTLETEHQPVYSWLGYHLCHQLVCYVITTHRCNTTDAQVSDTINAQVNYTINDQQKNYCKVKSKLNFQKTDLSFQRCY